MGHLRKIMGKKLFFPILIICMLVCGLFLFSVYYKIPAAENPDHLQETLTGEADFQYCITWPIKGYTGVIWSDKKIPSSEVNRYLLADTLKFDEQKRVFHVLVECDSIVYTFYDRQVCDLNDPVVLEESGYIRSAQCARKK